MKSVIIHGALLVVMSIYGYLAWTKEKAAPSVTGEVSMWSRNESDLKTIELATPDHTLKLERRGQGADAYWWGIDTRQQKKAKPVPPPPPPADPAAPPPPPPAPEFITETVVREFPVGEPGAKLIKELAQMKALRKMGVVKDADKEKYELVDTSKTITIVFNDGAKTLQLGGRAHGGSDRYILDVDSGKGFVLSGTLITPLEGGEGSLRFSDLRSFNPKDAMAVKISIADKQKTVRRIKVKKTAPTPPPNPHGPPPPPAKETEVETWGEGAIADTTAANFIDKVEKLKPTEYQPTVDPKTLSDFLILTYADGSGKTIGHVRILKRDNPGDPTKTPPVLPGPEYFLMTERTRVPALLPNLAVDRIIPDFESVFEAPKPPGEPAKAGEPSGAPTPAAPKPAAPAAPGSPAAPKPATPAAPKPATPAGAVPTPTPPMAPAPTH